MEIKWNSLILGFTLQFGSICMSTTPLHVHDSNLLKSFRSRMTATSQRSKIWERELRVGVIL